MGMNGPAKNKWKRESCMHQKTATEYQTQHNIEWPKGNHINTANIVDMGVLPQHHHAVEYYHHRGTSNRTNTYKDNNYGHYNSYGYCTNNEVEHNRYGSCGCKDYRDGYYDNYYNRGDYNCYAYYKIYGYDDCRYNHYKYGWKDVKEDVNADNDKTIITGNTHYNDNYFSSGSSEERMETERSQ